MSIIDLGDPLPDLSVTTYNSSGTPQNATAVVLTITLPDGTTVTPTVTAAGSGVYTATYTPTMRGRHVASWVATGTNASARSTTYNVMDPAAGIIGLADAQAFLNTFDPDAEEELRGVLEAVSDVCERFTRKTWRRQTYVETYTVGCDQDFIQLRHQPVLSVTSVVENGVTLSATDYTLDGRLGLLKRGSRLADVDWLEGFQVTVVTYVGGPTGGVVPANIMQGCRLLLHHMWTTQRGNALRGAGTGDDYDPQFGFYLPNKVRQAWGEPRVLVR
jgi:hypothetical protein